MAHCHYQDNNLILFCSLSQLIISTIAIFINNDISEKVKFKVVAAANTPDSNLFEGLPYVNHIVYCCLHMTLPTPHFVFILSWFPLCHYSVNSCQNCLKLET